MTKKKRKLNPRQRRFIKAYTDPKSPTFSNGTKTAVAVGYSKRAAKQSGSQVLTNIDVQSEIQREMDRLGLTVEHGLKRLKEGMSAEDVKVFQTKDGEIIYSVPLIAWQERRLAIEQVFKLRGLFPTNRTVERLELLRIQSTLIVVPGGLPEPEEKEKQVRQLTD